MAPGRVAVLLFTLRFEWRTVAFNCSVGVDTGRVFNVNGGDPANVAFDSQSWVGHGVPQLLESRPSPCDHVRMGKPRRSPQNNVVHVLLKKTHSRVNIH